MRYMFYVRFATAVPWDPQPIVGPSLRVHSTRAAVAPHAPPPYLPARTSRPALHALLSTRQDTPSLSDANKLLIRCAWAGTSAFASAGYGSSWGPGSCP